MILYDFVLYGRINKSPVLSNFERFIRRETMGDQAIAAAVADSRMEAAT